MKKDAYYFSHDSNSKDDPKCVLLIEQLGLEGYGIFWMLVETLRDQPDYKYPLSLLTALARRYNSTAQKVETVVKNYKLFQFTDDEFFFSVSLMERMEYLEKARLKKSIAGKKGNAVRWNNQIAIAETSQCDSNEITPPSQSIASKGKESKLKENKVKKIIYAERVQMLETEYEKLINQYSKSIIDNKIIDLDLWKGSKGKTTKSDYLTLLAWLRKDKPIIQSSPKSHKDFGTAY